ncbi:Glycosyltransferase involved in cell wall bisynthesis [Catalinimonas alkaloidigena]|uniref:Glycosyltransferase involved in cell wall bisynthesis n=1 Tax=Catalinimonas alkaloidigena TaxID=1075417 RepID=A0A1G9GU46_9BACT|nr:glycosyltransferase family 2 protein [Catalinimonas alkaloidigena]SDL04209.1 Glycosyltransferase involved in cell wall bisynthesis [Catalinimonas alkaloidigena]
MPPISAVIITYNEERNIARCLDSLQGVADEIVVVDSFSTDRTEEICRARGVRFLQHAFEGHIEQKNFAAAQARYPHVLSLDADEALDPTLQRSILAVKADWQHTGYQMNRLTNYCGHWVRHGGWYPDRKLRLWNRQFGQWGGTNPHDELRLTPEHSVGHLAGDLLHYSYYSLHDHVRQVNYFTDIMAQSQQHKGGSLLKVLLSPWVKFIKSYFFQAGFLDGYYGLVIAIISAHATFLKYAKIRELRKNR